MIITLNEELIERRNFIKTNEFVFFPFFEETTRDKQSFFFQPRASESYI